MCIELEHGFKMKELVEIIGESNVSFSDFERSLYSHDLVSIPKPFSKLFKTLPDAVAIARSAEEVSRIVKYANERGIPVTPRGSAT
ncbi:MAG: FAD-binding oxidoreductase [Fervidicoccaceae archaeon]|jgi:glycolate oxidase